VRALLIILGCIAFIAGVIVVFRHENDGHETDGDGYAPGKGDRANTLLGQALFLAGIACCIAGALLE
jgi:drug/metabolite transporter (DMT)-like permease